VSSIRRGVSAFLFDWMSWPLPCDDAETPEPLEPLLRLGNLWLGGRLNTNVRSPKIIKDGEARDKLGTTSDSSTVGKT